MRFREARPVVFRTELLGVRGYRARRVRVSRRKSMSSELPRRPDGHRARHAGVTR